MLMMLEIPDYNENNGLKYHWEQGIELSVENSDNEVSIGANKAGLISLAIQLLTLAQDNVPVGHHFHYDEHSSLEAGSKQFVIEKTK